MILQCKEYLKSILIENGIPQNNIHEAADAFGKLKPIPWAVILAQPEQLKELKKKAVVWTDTTSGKSYLRSQKFERVIVLELTFGSKNEGDVEEQLLKLLEKLSNGIDDGKSNFVRITPKLVKWITEESLLKAKAGAVLFIEFTGGIYVDSEINKAPANIKPTIQNGG